MELYLYSSIRLYGVERDKFVFLSVMFLLPNEIQNSSVRSPKNMDLIYGHPYLMYSERLRQFEGHRYNLLQDTLFYTFINFKRHVYI